MHACLCTMSMQCLWRPEEGVTYPGPGHKTTVTCHVGAEIEPRSSRRAESAFNC